MQTGTVTNRYVIANTKRPAVWVEFARVSAVQNGIILYACSAANADAMRISASNAAGPERDIITNGNVTYHDGAFVDEYIITKPRADIFVSSRFVQRLILGG